MPAIQITWILPGVSVAAEVLGTIGLKICAGFAHLLPTAFTVTCYTGAVWLMAISTKHIEIGMAYAVWAGASTALTALAGIAWFGESVTALKLLGLALAVVSLIVLNLSESPP
ncbi:DMT family transporter [Caballeronia mineralivorans]|jgi:small multidrug resistance pump|uniref:DMT family transporter n=1 Tax=Caballeronia mineralivorans TaxID=2010198 RepID=UPI0023F108A0|nr:SMR family transporter [Caballeronia mineralivorans]MDB5788386.1 small multidrug resistance protein [Caballeronia mineralivorans]MEA3097134.1 small multidrug resistance pump [Caballeronia mineralivorans]